jgi:integrase
VAIERRYSARLKADVYRVRYPDARRPGHWLSATFPSFEDANAFDAQWRVKQRSGRLAELDAGKELLGDYVIEWLKVWARGRAPKTVREQVGIIDRLILEMSGDDWSKGSLAWLQLRQVDAHVIERWHLELERRGVGVESRRKALYILRSVFRRAITYRDYPFSNPVDAVDKPKTNGRRVPTVFTPRKVERLRADFLRRGDLLSATIVSTLAYAGVRPGELFALQVKHFRDGRLYIEQRNSLGEVVDGAKSARRARRSVPLPAALVEDLKAWVESGNLVPESPLFPDSAGGFWNEWRVRNWRRRTYRPAALRAGLGSDSANPYTLRHVYVSLRYAAGDNPIDVAAAAGHSPTLSQDYYAKSIEAYERGGKVDLEAEIARARARFGALKSS